MDAKDRKIVRALQLNGRISNQELADEVGLSPSPCLRRVRYLEATGVIRGYHANVDATAYGMSVTAFVNIRLERHDEASVRRFEECIRGIEAILECHALAGTMNYQLQIVLPDFDGYEDFVRTHIHPIGGIASIDASFVCRTIKRETAFPQIT